MKRPTASTLWILAILAATFAVYVPSLWNGFTFDDRVVALGIRDDGQPNPRIFELQPLSVYFSTHYWADAVEHDTLFRPLTTLSFALRHMLFGDAAWPAHLANVLLHVWATWLVWRLLGRMGVATVGRTLGAAFFGLHALHTEVVATVVGRAELLSFCFGAAALLLACPGQQRSVTRRRLAPAAAAVLFFCALCSKESAIAWLPLLLLFGWTVERHGNSGVGIGRLVTRTLLVTVIPLTAFLLLRQQMIGGLTGDMDSVGWYVNPIHGAPLATRLMTATSVMAYGLWLCLAPFRLAADYGAQVFTVMTSFDLRFAGALLLMCALLMAGIVSTRRQPLLCLSIASFFGFALVTSNHLFPIGTIFGERLYYQPSLAVPIAVAWAAERLPNPGLPGRALLGVACVWLAVSASITAVRCPVWKDNATLTLHDVDVQPRSVRLQSLAGLEFHFRKDTDRALRHLQRATELAPDDPFGWNNLGGVYLQLARIADAERAFRRGLAARHLIERDSFNLHMNLGEILLRRPNPNEAVPELAAALASNPALVTAWDRLFVLHARKILRTNELAVILETLEHAAPDRPHWPCYRGILAHNEGQMKQATEILAPALEALGTHPNNSQLRSRVRFSLGHALSRIGRTAEARAVLTELATDRFADPAIRAEAQKLL